MKSEHFLKECKSSLCKRCLGKHNTITFRRTVVDRSGSSRRS